MNSARITLGLLPAALVFVLATGACSGSSKSGIPGTDTDPTTPEAAAPSDTSPEAGTDSAPAKDSSTTEPPAGECSGEVTQTACATCCTSKHEDGAAIYFVSLIDCMCVEANCAKDCKTTLCDPDAPKNADAKCQACVQDKNAACAPSIKATCTADPQCVAFDKCVGQSDCLGKAN